MNDAIYLTFVNPCVAVVASSDHVPGCAATVGARGNGTAAHVAGVSVYFHGVHNVNRLDSQFPKLDSLIAFLDEFIRHGVARGRVGRQWLVDVATLEGPPCQFGRDDEDEDSACLLYTSRCV